MNEQKNLRRGVIVLAVVLVFTLMAAFTQAADKGSDKGKGKGKTVLGKLNTISTLASTVPSNGDVNPYGVARVPHTMGSLKAGDILVSNFNNSANLQGTGTTIVDISPGGTMSLFSQIDPATLPGACPGGVGLTTALVVLHTGWVIVGSLPTTDGTSATAQAGCLIVLDSSGTPVETITDATINGPWDMTVREGKGGAALFVSNVLNGTVAGGGNVVNGGTVIRINLKTSSKTMPAVQSITVIADTFPERTDPDALVIGPTGLALSNKGNGHQPLTLYVADSVDSSVAAIPDPLNATTSAGMGTVLSSGGTLNTPLGLTVAPGGDILTVNGGDGNITEISPAGVQVASKSLDNSGGPPPGAGALFGLIFVPKMGVVFVDDATNTLNVLSH